MKDQSKTKQALIQELISLRHRVSEQEQSESNANGRTQEEDLVPLLNQRLYLLIETVQKLAQVRDLEGIMGVVRSAARALVGADGSTFVLREGDQCFYADEDAISPLWKGHRFPMSMCISGWVMMNHQIAVIKDIYADARIPAEAYRPTFVKSLTMVPIRSRDPLGAIGNYWAYLHSPTPEEVQLLQTLADATAIAMENVQSYNDQEQRLTERRQAEEKILASLREKDILISEIHHRVKNNLQVISGLLDLQAKASKNPEVIESFRESQNRIYAMAMVHEKLYNSEDYSRIDLVGYVRSLSQELFQSHTLHPGKIELTIQTDGEVYLDVIKAIPCGLILNELISNVLKHAFPEDRQGELQVIISKTENKEIEIVVRDTGLGLPDDLDIHEPRSVGLTLVNGLAKQQLDGQIEVRRVNGTEFRITFPL